MSVSLAVDRRIRIPNEEIMWAGDCPWTGGYCFGTESGRLLFCKKSPEGLDVEFSASLAGESINGVAFFNEYVGVSTPSEVIVRRRVSESQFETIADGSGGAHGILATPTGLFIAPMGLEGLLIINVRESGALHVWNDRARGASLNFYSATYLGNDGGQEVLAFAGRTDGLIKLQFDVAGVHSRTTTLTAPDADVVDVCALGSDRWPFAVAAFRRDRSVVLVRDVLNDNRPDTLQIDGILGTPYAIRSAQGHLFVLTSEQVTVFPNLARSYLEREQFDALLHSRLRHVHAVDMFISMEKELLILTHQEIEFDDIPKLAGPRSASGSPEPSTAASGWTDDEHVPIVSPFPMQWASFVA